MLEIISKAHYEKYEKKEVNFYSKDGEIRLGFDFSEVEEWKNNPNISSLRKTNYERACGDNTLIKKIEDVKYLNYHSAISKCTCGKVFELTDMFYGSCQCPGCQKWYNLFGQEVCSPIEQTHCYDW